VFCCAKCFGDRKLRKTIIALQTAVGKCSYCESEDVPLVAPAALSNYFEIVISAYRVDAGGKSLVSLFREDWGTFAHPRMDDFRAKDLLAEILDDHDIVRQTFSPAYGLETDWVSAWENLRQELMYRNRFFPEVGIDTKWLEAILDDLSLESGDLEEDIWYRARIQSGDAAFPVEKMGAPPARNALPGRANPAGIPYLYLGSKPATAIAEIRPHTGEIVCVADFKIQNDLRLADLRNPREMVSPFLQEDAEEIGKRRSALPFLERLGNDLTTPVLPHAAAIDYTPSQYLCEFIKKSGFDGVIYRSSVSDGINLALFNPARATVGSVVQYSVSRVSVEIANPAPSR
jgi:hypothetical protein